MDLVHRLFVHLGDVITWPQTSFLVWGCKLSFLMTIAIGSWYIVHIEIPICLRTWITPSSNNITEGISPPLPHLSLSSQPIGDMNFNHMTNIQMSSNTMTWCNIFIMYWYVSNPVYTIAGGFVANWYCYRKPRSCSWRNIALPSLSLT